MGKARTTVGNPLPAASRWTLGVAVATGVVLGALVAPGSGGPAPILALPEAQAPGWGAAWGADALGIEAAVARDLGERIVVVAVGMAALLGLALLTSLLRLVGEREAVRPGLAVRWALGRSPRTLAAGRLAAAARPVGRALAVGIAAGLAAALAVRLSWPVEGVAQGPSPALLLLLLPLLLAPLALALIWPVAGLETRAPELLRTGRGGTDDPKAGTVRRVAATFQLAAAAALVLAGATLGADRTEVDPEGLGLAGEDTVLVPLRPLAAGFDWGDLERLLGATAPESLSTPGAWTGRGVRDLVTVECGRCVRGGLPLPIYGVRATVHAVSSGFFAAAGMDLVEGRGFAPSDRVDSEAVAIVTAAFARDHFEGGRPLGKHIRLSGGGGQEWLRVVGVVEELDFAAPGSSPPGEPVLFLALAQHPASAVVWSTSEAPPDAEPAEAGVTVAGPVLPLLDVRRRERAPVRWTGAMLLAAGWIGLALSLLAGADTARAEVRGRWREAAIRASVGSPPRRLALRYLKRAALTAVVGALVGWILAWSVVATFGAGAHIPFAGAVALAALLLGASLAGAWAPSWRAAAEDPAVLLRDGG